MIKTIKRFFQVQIKSLLRDSIEFLQASFGRRPKTFDAVNRRRAIHKFIGTVINPQMFCIADINQSIVAAPLVRVNYRVHRDTPANHRLQRFLAAIRDNFRVDRAIPFEDAEDFGFAARTAPALAFNAPRAKVAFPPRLHS